MPKSKKLKDITINLLILALTLLFMAALSEIFIRVFFPTELNIVKPDNYMLYIGRPNISFTAAAGNLTHQIHFNSYGFFDKEWDAKSDDGKKRVLVIGDSFTASFNVPYDKNYARILGQLAENNGIPVDVMAAGIASWDTATELKFLERTGVNLNPDIVIVQLHGNDMKSNYLRGLFSIKDGKLIDNTPVKIPLRKRFMIYMATKSALFKRIYDFFLFNPTAQRNFPAFLGEPYVRGYRGQLCQDCNLFLQNPDEVHSTGFNITYRLFERLYELSEEYNFTPVIVLVPMKEQVSDDGWREFIKKPGGNSTKMIRNLNQVKLLNNAPEGMIVIDPYPELARINKNVALYAENDIHFNEKGNEVMANIIFAELRNKGVLTRS